MPQGLTRLIDGYHKLLGRETFIVPVVWEDDWPVVSPGTGKVEWTYPAPNLAPCPLPVPPAHDDFKNGRLSFEWNYLGTHLGTESAGGFVGVYAGLYATSGGEASDNHADFTYYEMLV